MNKDFNNATTALPINKGGTGATTQEQARENLGLGINSAPSFFGLELGRYVDLHNGDTSPSDDYNVRIINDSDKQLTICGFNGQKIRVNISGECYVDGNRYKHIHIQSTEPSGAPEGSIWMW